MIPEIKTTKLHDRLISSDYLENIHHVVNWKICAKWKLVYKEFWNLDQLLILSVGYNN